MKKAFLIVAAAAIAFAGCYTDNKEELYPDDSTGGGGICDTSGMSFATDIQPILNTNCALSNCHKTGSALGGYILDTYTGTQGAVTSGRLLGSIRHETGFSQMPKNASKLSDCNINKIAAWMTAGAPDN